MNYELAKKLKDAGFPQNTTQGLKSFNGALLYKDERHSTTESSAMQLVDRIRKSGKESMEELIYEPTLSELIEACIKIHLYFTLSKVNEHWWSGCSNEIIHQKTNIKIGSTPEESVAHLYLALNNKKDI